MQHEYVAFLQDPPAHCTPVRLMVVNGAEAYSRVNGEQLREAKWRSHSVVVFMDAGAPCASTLELERREAK